MLRNFKKQIRSHRGIENKLHWILAVALNLFKNEKTAKLEVKGKRLKAGWDNQYLLKVLNL